MLLFVDFFHEWWLLEEPFVSLSVYPMNLALHEFFQAINFHFTRTTKHQPEPTRNLHSSTELSAVTSTASQFHAYLFGMCDKIPQNLQVLTREVADYFIVFDHFPGKFINFIVKLLIYQKFFAYCGFPKNFIDVISLNSRVESENFSLFELRCFLLDPGPVPDSSPHLKLGY